MTNTSPLGSGLAFVDKGDKLEFRGNNRPACDYYPATGRWRVHRGRRFRYYRGGLVAFVNWYRKQESTEHEQQGLERTASTN